MIQLSIDVTLLQKSRFKEVIRKNGKKAVFCDLVLFESNSPYGDYIVKQSTTKEEKGQDVQLPILGNGKILEPKKQEKAPEKESDGGGEDQDVPF